MSDTSTVVSRRTLWRTFRFWKFLLQIWGCFTPEFQVRRVLGLRLRPCSPISYAPDTYMQTYARTYVHSKELYWKHECKIKKGNSVWTDMASLLNKKLFIPISSKNLRDVGKLTKKKKKSIRILIRRKRLRSKTLTFTKSQQTKDTLRITAVAIFYEIENRLKCT